MKPCSAPGDGAKAPAPRKAHILVVEDEVLIRMMVSDAFRDEGHSVIEAFNGDEAADLLMTGKAVDLIFSDVRMPGSLDGLGLLALVRDRFPDVPVILTSGHLEPREAMAEGARCFIGKPYLLGEVLTLVARELAEQDDPAK